MNKTPSQRTCVQCHNDMPYATDVQEKQVSVCLRPQCPNFGLLALALETIEEFEKEKK